MPEIGVNKVILVGRTLADTEIKYTAGRQGCRQLLASYQREL